MSPVDDLHAPVTRHADRSARTAWPSARPQAHLSLPAPASAERREPEPSTSPSAAGRPTPDRGLGLLIIFTAGVLVMVALISVTSIIGSWWVLAPVMVVDFAVTASVLAVIVRLLSN